MNSISLLEKGDTIAIVAPAKAIEEEHVRFAADFLEKRGFHVSISPHCLGTSNYFSGTIEERRADMQDALDDPNVKAILCARGGYGSIHLVDLLDWSGFQRSPKWIIGFSDVTVFHQRSHLLDFPSVHGSMPLNFSKNSQEALETLLHAITRSSYVVRGPQHENNIFGNANGELIGGNLSILYGLLATNDRVDYREKLLFIEDLGEHLYAIDRMFYAFRKAGVFAQIKGLVVGGMTDLKDTETPFGKSIHELILGHVESLGIPVALDFPAGHIDDNRALRFGSPTQFSVNENGSELIFGN